MIEHVPGSGIEELGNKGVEDIDGKKRIWPGTVEKAVVWNPASVTVGNSRESRDSTCRRTRLAMVVERLMIAPWGKGL
jgi:hypothetical protein